MINLDKTMKSKYDVAAFKTIHQFKDHPLLSIEKLSCLIQRLPRSLVFFSSANVSRDADFDRASIEHKPEISLKEALENLYSANSYIMVRSPELDPEYAPLFQEILHSLELFTKGHDPEIVEPMLYLFISSPNSTTPFHVDRYTTFLMQLEGDKQVHVWNPEDRETVTDEALETLFADPSHRSPLLPQGREESGATFELTPGEVLHIPFIAPHWVKNGPSVSVSLSIIYKSKRTVKKINSYVMNYHLRKKLHIKPAPVGGNHFRDDAKSVFIELGRKLKNPRLRIP